MVRLLQMLAVQVLLVVTRFNPTMVRLLHRRTAQAARLVEFQSHNGAIAALTAHKADLVFERSFNPTMVRLLHDELVASIDNFISFNPTMVRLLLMLRCQSQ